MITNPFFLFLFHVLQGLIFSVVASGFDESTLDRAAYASPAAFVEDNAAKKAAEVAQRVHKDCHIVLGM